MVRISTAFLDLYFPICKRWTGGNAWLALIASESLRPSSSLCTWCALCMNPFSLYPSFHEGSCSCYLTRVPKMQREFGKKERSLHDPILRPLGDLQQKSLEALQGQKYTKQTADDHSDVEKGIFTSLPSFFFCSRMDDLGVIFCRQLILFRNSLL